LGALAPELARADKGMKPQIVAELVNYKNQMVRFMPAGEPWIKKVLLRDFFNNDRSS
jgi:hypothetical protein